MASKPQQTIQLGDLTIDVLVKDIKQIHLSVYPPDGQVRISSPKNINPEALRAYAIAKLPWIRQQQRKYQTQPRIVAPSYINRESHYVWGKRYLLKLTETSGPSGITLHPKHLHLHIHNKATPKQKQKAIDAFYRQLLRNAVPPLIQTWEQRMEVSVQGITIRKMKTKWGSCSPHRGTIRLNLDLAQKPPECLEYVIVHEMTHLLESTHNSHFIRHLNQFLPQWQSYRQTLNDLPLPNAYPLTKPNFQLSTFNSQLRQKLICYNKRTRFKIEHLYHPLIAQ